MSADIEELLKRRDRCLALARYACSDAVRDKLIRIARSYELDVVLIEKALRCIAESKELVVAADTLLKQANKSRSPAVTPLHRPKLVGEVCVSQVETKATLLRQPTKIAGRLGTLTPREREIMSRIVAGNANKVIAAELGVSQRTIEHHRQSIMRKMGAKSLAVLVRMAIQESQTLPHDSHFIKFSNPHDQIPVAPDKPT